MTTRIPRDNGSFIELFSSQIPLLQTALPGFLVQQRWFAAKAQTISHVTVTEAISLGSGCQSDDYWLILAEVLLSDRTSQQYSIPLVVEPQQNSSDSTVVLHLLPADAPPADGDTRTLEVADATSRPAFWQCFVERSLSTEIQNGQLTFVPADHSSGSAAVLSGDLSVEFCNSSQSNTTVFLDTQSCLKLFRRPASNLNPDVETGLFLTTRTHYRHSPPVIGHIELIRGNGSTLCLAMITEFVPASGDAWAYTVSQIDGFWEQMFNNQTLLESSPVTVEWTIAASDEELSDHAHLLGDFPAAATLLGQRTAELHIALASDSASNEFCPEPESIESVREHLRTLRSEVATTTALLESAPLADSITTGLVERIAGAAGTRLDTLEAAAEALAGPQIRVHGDYHLGQVLRTVDDFMIIDFEGEPDRSPEARRRKSSVMKDLAGLIRSFHYASCAGAVDLIPCLDDRNIPGNVSLWQNFWFSCAARCFLNGYLKTAAGQEFLPESRYQAQQLLDLHLLEKVLYELRYELNNRPDWVAIPLTGLTAMLNLQGTE